MLTHTHPNVPTYKYTKTTANPLNLCAIKTNMNTYKNRERERERLIDRFGREFISTVARPQ